MSLETVSDIKKSLKTRLQVIEKSGLRGSVPVGTGATDLETLCSVQIGDCKRCKLSRTRQHIVFGTGNPHAKLVFVGEAPGADEDEQGVPFVGRAGKLLTKMIEAMGYTRDQVYICNVIKCRPPENRNPEADEVEACEPFLKKQLALIQPQVIVALGRYACQSLLKFEGALSTVRGDWAKYEGIDLMPTFHPAYLLRNPPKKKEAWEDLQKVMTRLN
jgi:uracil-DNA glycosylase family 4